MADGVKGAIQVIRAVIGYIEDLFHLFDGDADEVQKHIESLRVEIAERRKKRDEELQKKHAP